MGSNAIVNMTADSAVRNPKSPYDASQDTIISDWPLIAQLHTLHPNLKIYTRSSPSFASIRKVYQLYNTNQPLAICRPSTPTEVAAIVSFCVSTGTPLTVRSGGHDDSGRSCIQDGIVIDMREIDGITLSADKKTAAIGGGTLALNLTRFLHPHGLVTAVGECSSVGVVNWAACGGYGILNGPFGLGVDQIVGARVVNAQGRVVDADEEMLWGIRGAGGNFGVIVQLTIKVHALSKMLAGFIAFPFAEGREVLTGYQALLDEEYPDPWSGALGVFNMHGAKVVLFFATWSSVDLERGKIFIDRVRGLGTVAVDNVVETTLKEFLEISGSIGPPGSFQAVKAPYVEKLSKAVIEAIIEYGEKMPDDPACMINLHSCHGRGAQPDSSACFSQRGAHMIVQIIGATVKEANMEVTHAWAAEMGLALKRNGLVLEGGYVNLMGIEDPVERCFGDSWDSLKALKRKLDSENIFAHAVPSLA